MKAVLFSSYIPPTSYIGALLKADDITIDIGEHFVKQTYRNRCHIQTSNGSLHLIVPFIHGKQGRQAMKDVKISYETKWQRLHWRSLTTAYRRSSYFEYYEHKFKPLFEQEFELLSELNAAWLTMILNILKSDKQVNYSQTYIPLDLESGHDLRAFYPPNFSLKEEVNPIFNAERYFQVFESKLGFMKDLSIIDLLCNEGPASVKYLESTSNYLGSPK